MNCYKHFVNVSETEDGHFLTECFAVLLFGNQDTFFEFSLLIDRWHVFEIKSDVLLNIFIIDNHSNLSISSHFIHDVLNNLHAQLFFAIVVKSKLNNALLDISVLLNNNR